MAEYVGGSTIRLSTGTEVYAYAGVLGLLRDEDGVAMMVYGYDGHVGDSAPPLSADQKRELADFAIAHWQAYKDAL